MEEDMGYCTVHLDAEAEAVLEEIRRRTGMSISEALKMGLLALQRRLSEPRRTAWEVYEKIDLGPGGYAAAAAVDVKKALRKIIGRKHRR